MFSSWFGAPAPAPAPDEPDPETAKREARRKAAAEARKIREETKAAASASSEEISGFAVGKSARRSSKSTSAASPSMPAISEEALRGIESAKRAVAALPVEKAPDLDKNVADLMQQVRLQHEEELNSSLNAARHSAASEMQEELEAKFAITRKELESGFAAKLEAAQEVAAGQGKGTD